MPLFVFALRNNQLATCSIDGFVFESDPVDLNVFEQYYTGA
jgi:hypothetical protein